MACLTVSILKFLWVYQLKTLNTSSEKSVFLVLLSQTMILIP